MEWSQYILDQSTATSWTIAYWCSRIANGDSLVSIITQTMTAAVCDVRRVMKSVLSGENQFRNLAFTSSYHRSASLSHGTWSATAAMNASIAKNELHQHDLEQFVSRDWNKHQLKASVRHLMYDRSEQTAIISAFITVSQVFTRSTSLARLCAPDMSMITVSTIDRNGRRHCSIDDIDRSLLLSRFFMDGWSRCDCYESAYRTKLFDGRGVICLTCSLCTLAPNKQITGHR